MVIVYPVAASADYAAARGKSLLESWVTTFHPDGQPPFIFIRFKGGSLLALREWDRHTDRHTYYGRGIRDTYMGQTDRQTHKWDRHTVRHTYGKDIQRDTNMGQRYRQTHIWDRQTYRQTHTHMGQTYRQTHLWDRHTDRHIWPVKNSFYARNFFVCAPILGLGFFQTPQTHGESVHVLRFKIGPETKAGGRIGHTNGQLSL